ncbi:hypothetical protein V7x_44230 [Crateriforma conspicua]|uniref:Uncharacterized protein n=1 Tax=Crateriforma conspicua TaxID=2527996 RepID=A0A5C6FKZ6_9PLAN|nr:YdjY domain-containing protein [Crateriforma conspicua]TWU62687.1 hypothetical protein V7x_44230 [Crateriforma conspicua]
MEFSLRKPMPTRRRRWRGFVANVAAAAIILTGGTVTGQGLPPLDEIQAQADDSPMPGQDDTPQYVDQVAAKAFAPPPEAKRLSKSSNLWIDRQRKRVYVDGYVTLDRGMLEMFACPSGTKEHESVVALLAKSREVHTALLAVGAKSGTVVRYEPRFVPPTGQAIRIWVCFRDKNQQFQVADGRKLVRNIKTKKPLSENWVFAGSEFWTDPIDGKRYYQADGGDMICVSNFGTAMLDVPFESSAQSADLLFEPFTENLPPRDTPVRVVMVPIPFPTDDDPVDDGSSDNDPDEDAKSTGHDDGESSAVPPLLRKPTERILLPPAKPATSSDSSATSTP